MAARYDNDGKAGRFINSTVPTGGPVQVAMASTLADAAGQGPHLGALRVTGVSVLLLTSVAAFMVGLIIGDQSPDDDRSWLLWELCAWLTFGGMIACLSLVAVVWYLSVSVGLCLFAALVRGLRQLVELTEGNTRLRCLSWAGAGAI
jgi:hypothetical protein